MPAVPPISAPRALTVHVGIGEVGRIEGRAAVDARVKAGPVVDERQRRGLGDQARDVGGQRRACADQHGKDRGAECQPSDVLRAEFHSPRHGWPSAARRGVIATHANSRLRTHACELKPGPDWGTGGAVLERNERPLRPERQFAPAFADNGFRMVNERLAAIPPRPARSRASPASRAAGTGPASASIPTATDRRRRSGRPDNSRPTPPSARATAPAPSAAS